MSIHFYIERRVAQLDFQTEHFELFWGFHSALDGELAEIGTNTAAYNTRNVVNRNGFTLLC